MKNLYELDRNNKQVISIVIYNDHIKFLIASAKCYDISLKQEIERKIMGRKEGQSVIMLHLK